MSCIKKGKNSRRAAPDGGNGRLVPDLRRLLKDMAGKGYFCWGVSFLCAASVPCYRNSFTWFRRRFRIFSVLLSGSIMNMHEKILDNLQELVYIADMETYELFY